MRIVKVGEKMPLKMYYLTMCGLAVTLTFDLKISIDLCPHLHLSCKFG